jgi:hypothetical protein
MCPRKVTVSWVVDVQHRPWQQTGFRNREHYRTPAHGETQTYRQNRKQVNKTELVNKHSATHALVSNVKRELMLNISIFGDNMPCTPMKESLLIKLTFTRLQSIISQKDETFHNHRCEDLKFYKNFWCLLSFECCILHVMANRNYNYIIW